MKTALIVSIFSGIDLPEVRVVSRHGKTFIHHIANFCVTVLLKYLFNKIISINEHQMPKTNFQLGMKPLRELVKWTACWWWHFTCVVTISLNFEFYFLDFLREIVFDVTPGNYWGPVRVNSDRRHGSETATRRSWNGDERQAASWQKEQGHLHFKIRQRLAAHSAHSSIAFYNKVKLSVSLTVYCVSSDSLLSSSLLIFHITSRIMPLWSRAQHLWIIY